MRGSPPKNTSVTVRMVARILQKKVDALSCCLLTHESLGSAIVALRSKTVGAAEIAIIGNVEYKAALREGLAGKLRREGNWFAPDCDPSSVSKTPIA